ncbi:hypothetical protein LP7551_05004 [Roseibium album]|nr:hypothetical protein LP7551_05004 [Roseibium album]
MTGKSNNATQVLVAIFASLNLFISSSFAFEVLTLKPYGYANSPYEYLEVLLTKSLDKAGVSANIVRSDTDFSRDRLLQELISGENVHVMAHAPKSDWEKNLLTIRIPLRKGITGYRLFLINKQDQAALSKVTTLEELKAFPTGSGAQWSMRRVLEDAGFQVVTTSDDTTLFNMLAARRFLTFGRGIYEAYNEHGRLSAEYKNLAVEQDLTLFFPLPTYFFVSPAHPELAQHIETGLRRMIEDGSFDEHFLSYHQEDIDRAKLADRKIFKIPNPNLSKDTPINEPLLWFDPGS